MAGEMIGLDAAALKQQQMANLYTLAVQASELNDSAFNGLGGSFATTPLNTSIFGNNYGSTAFGGGYYGMFPKDIENMKNMTSSQYALHLAGEQAKMEDYQLDRSIIQSDRQGAAKLRASGTDDAVNLKAGILQSVVNENEQEEVLVHYGKLKESIRAKLQNSGFTPSENQVRSQARKAYFEATGKNLTEDIRENGDSYFTKGLKQGAFGIGWLFTDGKSAEATVDDINGVAHTKSAKAKQIAGMVLSGFATLGATILLVKGGRGAAKLLSKGA